MEYLLLGPLEVLADGSPMEISSTRQRILLAMLLLEANHAVPLSRLADAIWDDDPPTTAKSQVQTCVSVLRRQLAGAGDDEAIATRSAGYAIRVPENALDIMKFERMTARSRAAAADDRPEEAVRELRAALALWRGPAAAGVPSRLVEAAATRLNENRLGVLENCIELELSLGRHRGLIGELSELVRQFPLRERLRAQHMLALYRSARQAEALESFHEARRIITEEIGLEPGAELAGLQRAILAADPALNLDHQPGRGPQLRARAELVRAGGLLPGSGLVPHQLPAAIADFTGREAALADLIRVLSADDDQTGGAGSVPVVTLTGKGGVGKTALALRAAHAVQDHYPDGQLFTQLQEADGQPIGVMDTLARFLRAFGMPATAIPDDLTERTAAYRSFVGTRRALIILDDAASVGQVVPLIPGAAGCAVIVTSRNPMSGLHGARHVQVDDLDEPASMELLARVVGGDRVRAEESSARALVRLCGCLPLALRIAAAKLGARPHWRIEQMVRRMADEKKRLDELALSGVGIRTTLSLSYRSLDEKARSLLRRLGMLGAMEFAAWMSAPLMDHDAYEAEDVLDSLVEAHLVQARSTSSGPRFHLHELVRIYAAERLAAEEPLVDSSAALRRTLGCWLALAEEAHRRTYGGHFAVLHGRATRWPLPAAVVDQLLETPMAWFRAERAGLVAAVLMAAQSDLDELCWDLAMTSVTLFESDYEVDDWRRTHEAALEVTRRAGNRRGEAAMLYSLGNLTAGQRPADAARYQDAAMRAFCALDDSHGRALTLANMAFADRLSGRYEQARTRYRQALEGFRLVGDLVGETDALTNLAQIHSEAGQFDEAEQLLDNAEVICRSLGAPRVMAQTEYRRAEFFLQIKDLDRAETCFRLVLNNVQRQGDLVGNAYALLGLGQIQTLRGLYERAEASLAQARELSVHLGDNLVRGQVMLASAELCLAQGRADQAASIVRETATLFGESGPAGLWRRRVSSLQSRIDTGLGQSAGPACESEPVT
jgi:DNA-binding SARP family transcriptional activator